VNGRDHDHDPWPERGRTSNRAGYAPYSGPRVPVEAWRTFVDPETSLEINEYEANPLLDKDGKLFVVTNRHVSALDATTGDLYWQFSTPKEIPSTPSIRQGRIVFGCWDKRIYCLDSASGSLLWFFQDEYPALGGQAVDANGVVYYSSGDGQIGVKNYARRIEDGSLVWAAETPAREWGHPALDEARQLLYSGRQSGAKWVCRRMSDGGQEWSFQLGRDTFYGSPVVNGLVYVGCTDRLNYCIDAETGQLLWTLNGVYYTDNKNAVGEDGTLYTAHGNGTTNLLYAVDPLGNLKWSYQFAEGYNADQPPIVDLNGTVYIATRNSVARLGKVYAINSDGTLRWSYDFPGNTSAPPTLGPDGTLYVLCKDRYVYAFRDWQRTNPSDFTIRYGSLVSGQVSDLAKDDGSYLILSSQSQGPTPIPFLIEATYGQNLLHSTVASLDLKLDTKASLGGIRQEIRLRRRATNTFDLVDSRIIGTTDTLTHLQNIPNGQDYVRSQDGRVEVRVTYRPTTPLPLGLYKVSQDHLEVYAKFK